MERRFLLSAVVLFLLQVPLLSCLLDKAGGQDSKSRVEPVDMNGDMDGFELKASMQGDVSLVGKSWKDVDAYMKKFGWEYTEHPNNTEKDHTAQTHIEVLEDEVLNQYVFRFIAHCNADALDGDRGSISDRQRNEMKSRTSPQWRALNGNWDEYEKIEWRFRIPKGFQPSANFCHIHQLKAQEGNNGAPLITLSLRSNPAGDNKRVQVIHTGDVRSTNKGVIIDDLPLSEFEGEWIQAEEIVHFTHNGSYSIRLTRISDGKVLVEKTFTDIDMWRNGAINIRNKFGIYRSFGSKMNSSEDRPENGIKDEILDVADFHIYEKNTNQSPTAHE